MSDDSASTPQPKRRILRPILLALRELATYAWLPALVISSISAYFAFQNYSLQTSGNRPELVYTRLVLNDPYDQATLEMSLRNVGNRPARNLKIMVGTTDPQGKRLAILATVVGSNVILKDGAPGARPKINVKDFLGVLVVCTQYTDADKNQFTDVAFHKIPNLKPGLTKEQGGGGEYTLSDVLPEERDTLTKLSLCG